MKKLRSNSKRKWIVGGVMFFGGIGLLTTGFATWVVGTQVLNQQDKVGITVDTADNDSVSLAATLTPEEAFHLGETGVNTGEGNIVTTEGGTEADLKLVFTEIRLEASAKHFDANFGASQPVKFTFNPLQTAKEGNETNGFDANKVAKQGNLVDSVDGGTPIRTGESWDYVELSNLTFEVTPNQAFVQGPHEEGPTITIASVSEWLKDGNIYTLTLQTVEITYRWGSFFNHQSPATFYNSKKDIISKSLKKLDKVEEELDAMSTALNTKTFHFELAVDESKA